MDGRSHRRGSSGRGIFFVIGVALLLAGLSPAGASVNTSKTYGKYNGYVWLAHYNDLAELHVSSTKCNVAEPDAYSVTWNTTKKPENGTSEFWNRWPRGLVFSTRRCDGKLEGIIDVVTKYSSWKQTRPGKTSGAAVDWVMGDRDFCQLLHRVSYPCGRAYSRVQINLDRWDNYDAGYRVRLVTHEFGHVAGLRDHEDCDHPTVTDNGAICTPLQSGGYQEVDRTAISSIYPGWRYN